MNSFTQTIKKDAKVIFDAGNTQILDINNQTILQQNNKVVCIPYLIEKNSILLRYENIKAFNQIRPEIDKYITIMQSDIIDDKTPLDVLKDTLISMYGIELKDDVKAEFLSPIFLAKDSTAQYYICILPLMEYQYTQIIPSELEEMKMRETNIILNTSDLSNIIIYDLLTRYTIDLFKQHYALI